MPAVRAHMVFAALAEHGELLGSVPSQDGIELFSGRNVEVWIASEHEEQELAAVRALVSDVAGVKCAEADSRSGAWPR